MRDDGTSPRGSLYEVESIVRIHEEYKNLPLKKEREGGPGRFSRTWFLRRWDRCHAYQAAPPAKTRKSTVGKVSMVRAQGETLLIVEQQHIYIRIRGIIRT